MNSREILSRATRDCFKHLGIEATYQSSGGASLAIRVLKFASDTEYELGSGQMVGNVARFELMADDVERSLPGHIIRVDGMNYKIIGEPVRNYERSTVGGLSVQKDSFFFICCSFLNGHSFLLFKARSG